MFGRKERLLLYFLLLLNQPETAVKTTVTCVTCDWIDMGSPTYICRGDLVSIESLGILPTNFMLIVINEFM